MEIILLYWFEIDENPIKHTDPCLLREFVWHTAFAYLVTTKLTWPHHLHMFSSLMQTYWRRPHFCCLKFIIFCNIISSLQVLRFSVCYSSGSDSWFWVQSRSTRAKKTGVRKIDARPRKFEKLSFTVVLYQLWRGIFLSLVKKWSRNVLKK